MSVTRNVVAAIALSMGTGVALADFVGLNIDAQQLYVGPSGGTSSYDSSIDIVDDFGTQPSEQSSMVLILEHPIAALPNIRYQGFDLDSEAGIYGSDVYSGKALTAASDGATAFDLEHENIVLYYQLLDNWVDLDMGVDLKRFDGQLSSLETSTSTADVDETIPLLHLSARFQLPIEGLYVGANINTAVIDLGISDSDAQDSTILLGYDTGAGLGIEGGFKSYWLQLNETEDASADLEYDGLFVNGYFNF